MLGANESPLDDKNPRETTLELARTPPPLGREKIFSNNVAHVLNDETSRKYIQSLKRLVRSHGREARVKARGRAQGNRLC